ncbi:MAG: M20/M25/M40 family metallo-hydrolase [Planctomycetota bacterium]
MSKQPTEETPSTELTIDEDRAIETAMRLLRVPGVSCHEQAIAETIVDLLAEAGAPRQRMRFDNAHKKSPYGGECGNLVVNIPGSSRAPRRLLMAHVDTVPICRDARPVRRRNHITSEAETGVGADNRSGVGAVLTAAIEILDGDLPHPPLTLLFTVQEEIGLVGARFVDLRYLGRPKFAFNWDGGDPNCLEIGATGGFHLEIDVAGIPAHAGGQPERGVSAAMITALALADLQENGWFGLVMKDGVRGTSNIGVIEGGEATNVVLDRLHLEGECRSFSKSLRCRIASNYRKAFERAAKTLTSSEGRRGTVRFQSEKKYEAFKLSKKDPSVSEAVRVLHGLDLRPTIEYSNGGLDANWLAERGLHVVTLGAGTVNAHTTDEKLDIPQYLAGCRIALGLATGM